MILSTVSPQDLCQYNNKGFTIVELVLTIVIASILFFAVFPKLFSVLTFTSNTFYLEVLNSIRYAQKVAVGMGCDVEVSHTASSLSLTLRQNCTSGAFTQPLRDPAFGAISFVKNAPTDVTISSTDFPIYFDKVGQARNGGTNNISDASLDVNGRVVEVVGITGFTYEP